MPKTGFDRGGIIHYPLPYSGFSRGAVPAKNLLGALHPPFASTVAGILWFVCVIAASDSVGETLNLALTSDIHGRLSNELTNPRRKPAGLFHLQRAIRREREKNPDLILLDAGDLLQGSPLQAYFNQTLDPAKNNPFFETVQSLRYDAVAVGNHDLEINPVFEKYYAPLSNFTWLAANISRKGIPVFQPYKIVKRKSLKIAILGLTTPGTQIWVDPARLDGIVIESMAESARKWLKIIREKERPDYIVGLFHSGINSRRDDINSKLARKPPANAVKEVIRKAPGFDLIVAGHDHRLSPYRIGEKAKTIRGVPVLEPGRWGEALIVARIFIPPKSASVQSARALAVEIRRPAAGSRDDAPYKSILPREYLNFLYQKTAWRMGRSKKKELEDCLNRIHSLSLNAPRTDGSLLPFIRLSILGLKTGNPIRRIDLFRWFPYDNVPVTTKLSRRDIELLSRPYRLRGKIRQSYNKILYPNFNSKLMAEIDSQGSWLLSPEKFERKFIVTVGNYHVNGGGGVFPRIFLKKDNILSYYKQSLREKLFEFLSRADNKPPDSCKFEPV